MSLLSIVAEPLESAEHGVVGGVESFGSGVEGLAESLPQLLTHPGEALRLGSGLPPSAGEQGRSKFTKGATQATPGAVALGLGGAAGEALDEAGAAAAAGAGEAGEAGAGAAGGAAGEAAAGTAGGVVGSASNALEAAGVAAGFGLLVEAAPYVLEGLLGAALVILGGYIIIARPGSIRGAVSGVTRGIL